jgi:hypothetical protein
MDNEIPVATLAWICAIVYPLTNSSDNRFIGHSMLSISMALLIKKKPFGVTKKEVQRKARIFFNGALHADRVALARRVQDYIATLSKQSTRHGDDDSDEELWSEVDEGQ